MIEKGRWITVKGTHVFIKDGQTVGEAIQKMKKRSLTRQENFAIMEERDSALTDSQGFYRANTNYESLKAYRIDHDKKTRGFLERTLAMSLRKSPLHILTEEEIESIKGEARDIGIDASILSFNTGTRTGFDEERGTINIRGDVFPDLKSTKARDKMSVRAVLAHEYYGHYLHHPSEYDIGDWRDEFRASYQAAMNAPNLTDEDRADLIVDAYDRAKESGHNMRYSKEALKIVYGY